MRNHAKISVIVPVYNVERYMERSVKSVQNQTFSELEILLIDDGSTDRSGYLCDELQKSDSRIRVIHKNSGGLSDARNVGQCLSLKWNRPVASKITRYKSGKLVPHGDFLLMSFAKLNENGSGELTHDEFLDCLSILWEEIDKYYGQKDVCIPILGSGITRMGDESLTQQKLLDIIIGSYRLSPSKLKLPCQLHIVCK